MTEIDMRSADIPIERVRMRKEDRRAAVLDEAIRIIGEQGYNGFSINDLAKRCGLTTAGLLHHFVSKEGLLVSLLEERDRRNAEVIGEKLELRWGQTLTREQVLKVLHTIMVQSRNQPHLLRLNALLRAEALIHDHPARKYFLDRENATIALFSRLIAPHASDPSAAAAQLCVLMDGLEAHWLRQNCEFDLVEAWDCAATKLLI